MSKQRKIHHRVVQQLKGYTNEPRWRQRINLLLKSGPCIRWISRLSYCVLGSRTGWVTRLSELANAKSRK